MRSLSILVAAALFLPGTVLSEDENTRGFDFERHDTNGDGYLTEAEWMDAGNDDADFGAVDVNSDGYLDEHEANAASERTVQESGADAGEITPEEDYLGTGYNPVGNDAADNGVISAETEAAASGKIERGSGVSETENSEISADEYRVRGRDAEQSLDELDTSGDGRVSRQEAEADPELGAAFVSRDSNQDGYLDQQEIERVRSEQSGRESDNASKPVSLEEHDRDDDGRIEPHEASGDVDFETLDMNNDGYLDEAEVNYEPGEREIADAAGFEEHDTDGDGRLNRNEAANDAYLDANFDAWDADQDGHLDEEEINNGWLEESSATPTDDWRNDRQRD